MKYFFDTEFHESFTNPLFGKSRHFIDLISIGIVSEDGRTYYAISNEFDLNKVYKDEWLRENVLKNMLTGIKNEKHQQVYFFTEKYDKSFYKAVINKYGKSNKQIAAEIFDFVNPDLGFHVMGYSNSDLRPEGKLFSHFEKHNVINIEQHYVAQPEFYSYYADYDWVLLCSLFGRMMDLPLGFPMYCNDLKQMLHEYSERLSIYRPTRYMYGDVDDTPEIKFSHLTNCGAWDKLKNQDEHNALADANYHKRLYDYLQTRKFQ